MTLVYSAISVLLDASYILDVFLFLDASYRRLLHQQFPGRPVRSPAPTLLCEKGPQK